MSFFFFFRLSPSLPVNTAWNRSGVRFSTETAPPPPCNPLPQHLAGALRSPSSTLLAVAPYLPPPSPANFALSSVIAAGALAQKMSPRPTSPSVTPTPTILLPVSSQPAPTRASYKLSSPMSPAPPAPPPPPPPRQSPGPSKPSTAASRLQQLAHHMASPATTASSFPADAVPQAPEDALFGLMAAYRADESKDKVDLVGGIDRPPFCFESPADSPGHWCLPRQQRQAVGAACRQEGESVWCRKGPLAGSDRVPRLFRRL